MLIIILVILLLLSVGAYPNWNYSRDWGRGPSSMLFLLCIVLLVVFLVTGRI